MGDVMVTARMPERKKQRAQKIIHRSDKNTSQVINMLFDRILSEGNLNFLEERLSPSHQEVDRSRWQRAMHFVDSLSEEKQTRFDAMTKDEIKRERLQSRGLISHDLPD